MIVGSSRIYENPDATRILKNFLDAFYENDETKIQFCVDNPEKCAMIFSKPETFSNNYKDYDFRVNIEINDLDKKAKKNSLSLTYFLRKEQNTIEIFDLSLKKLSHEANYILFKLNNNICIMPLVKSQNSCTYILGGISSPDDDLQLLRRGCFYKNEEPNEKLLRLQKCAITIMTDEEVENKIQEFLTTTNKDLDFYIEFKGEEINNLSFQWIQIYEAWHLTHPNPQPGTPIGESVKNEQLFNESYPNNILMVNQHLKNIILELKTKDKKEGILFFLNYEHENLEIIKINKKSITEIKNILKYQGIEVFESIFI